MHIEGDQPLPRSLALLRAIRLLIALIGLAALALGTFASADALVASSRTPDDRLAAFPGALTLISGRIPGDAPDSTVFVRSEPQGLFVESIVYSRALLSDAMRWSAVVRTLPDAAPGRYDIIASAATGSATQPFDRWRMTVHPDKEAYEAASPSVMLHRFSVEPLDAALVSLAVAIVCGLLYAGMLFLCGKALMRLGFCRVYYTRSEGDDTFLYCIDQEMLLADDRSYPVLSAAGQLLGLADVTSRGARYCVLRLASAQARAGCMVSLGA